MKIKEIMSQQVVGIDQSESVAAAARTLSRYNIGILPVLDNHQHLQGLVTDRDLVIRCLATGHDPKTTPVKKVMTGRIISVQPDMEVGVAAHLMAREQVRRLPVVQDGKLCGMVSLGDMAVREENAFDATDALSGICSQITDGCDW